MSVKLAIYNQSYIVITLLAATSFQTCVYQSKYNNSDEVLLRIQNDFTRAKAVKSKSGSGPLIATRVISCVGCPNRLKYLVHSP